MINAHLRLIVLNAEDPQNQIRIRKTSRILTKNRLNAGQNPLLERRRVCRTQSCAHLIMYEVAEVQVVGCVPVRHCGVVHNDWVEHHRALVEVSIGFVSVQWLPKIECFFHHHGVGLPV